MQPCIVLAWGPPTAHITPAKCQVLACSHECLEWLGLVTCRLRFAQQEQHLGPRACRQSVRFGHPGELRLWRNQDPLYGQRSAPPGLWPTWHASGESGASIIATLSLFPDAIREVHWLRCVLWSGSAKKLHPYPASRFDGPIGSRLARAARVPPVAAGIAGTAAGTASRRKRDGQSLWRTSRSPRRSILGMDPASCSHSLLSAIGRSHRTDTGVREETRYARVEIRSVVTLASTLGQAHAPSS